MSDNYDDDRCPACWCRACMCCERDATLLHDPHERATTDDSREFDRAKDLDACGGDPYACQSIDVDDLPNPMMDRGYYW